MSEVVIQSVCPKGMKYWDLCWVLYEKNYWIVMIIDVSDKEAKIPYEVKKDIPDGSIVFQYFSSHFEYGNISADAKDDKAIFLPFSDVDIPKNLPVGTSINSQAKKGFLNAQTVAKLDVRPKNLFLWKNPNWEKEEEERVMAAEERLKERKERKKKKKEEKKKKMMGIAEDMNEEEKEEKEEKEEEKKKEKEGGKKRKRNEDEKDKKKKKKKKEEKKKKRKTE